MHDLETTETAIPTQFPSRVFFQTLWNKVEAFQALNGEVGWGNRHEIVDETDLFTTIVPWQL
jgi:hypothetical protein